jgi:hypothetical protein
MNPSLLIVNRNHPEWSGFPTTEAWWRSELAKPALAPHFIAPARQRSVEMSKRQAIAWLAFPSTQSKPPQELLALHSTIRQRVGITKS